GTRSRFEPERAILSSAHAAGIWPGVCVPAENNASRRPQGTALRRSGRYRGENTIMRKSLVAASLLALTVAVAPACATKKFVRTEVGGVNQKVDTLTGTVEETQERTRKNAERIGVVDQKAESAGKAAATAQTAADAAQRTANEANTRATEA